MDFSIIAILAQDGITSGAIYALLALALVLVFSVTRIIFFPQGEFVAFGALTLAALQAQRLPPTAWLLLALGALVFVAELLALLRRPEQRRLAGRVLPALAAKYLAFPLGLFLLAQWLAPHTLPMMVQVALALAIVVPMGPLLYRLAYQPLEKAPVLILLIASVALHFIMVGLGLWMFGADGFRTTPFSDAQFNLAGLSISGQSLIVLAVSAVLIVGLYLYFGKSLSGKALRATAVNSLGAQLVGISPSQSGKLAITLAAAIGALCGILIAPLTTIYYDSGFLIGLKGFVGAIFGGLGSYPLAAVGAIVVGLLESYASFWASAFKEVIVFTLIIPILIWRSLLNPHSDDDEH
jgi:branched-chain amino acid transport system permease protein